MKITGNNYLNIRNNFLLPLIAVSSSTDHQYFNLRTALENHTNNVAIEGSNNYSISINKDIFYRSLLVEIIQFYLRSALQYQDLRKLENIVSRSWLLVTNYYMNFFCATCLLRVLHKGFIYIDHNLADKLSQLFTILSSSPVRINQGTYFFQYAQKNLQDVKLGLKRSERTVHEATWQIFCNSLIEMEKNSTDEERTILVKIRQAFKCYGDTFMSSLRNDVNYKGIYAHEEIDKSFYFNLVQGDAEKIGRNILKSRLDDTIDCRTNITNLIGMYFLIFNHKLFEEIITRSSNEIIYYKRSIKNKVLDKRFFKFE